jgi:hypothetical protein
MIPARVRLAPRGRGIASGAAGLGWLPADWADPSDGILVRRLAAGGALDQAGVRFDIGWPPLKAVGVQSPRGEQERRTLVGVR